MTRTDTLSPQDAAEALRGLEAVEQRLSYKAGAISWMLYGLAAAGIFATYGMMDTYFTRIGAPWAYSFLWMPWIAAATLGTNALWRLLNMSMARPTDEGTRHTWNYTAGYCTLFLAIGAAAWYLLAAVLDLRLSMHIVMTLTIGLFTGFLAMFQARHYDAPLLRGPFVAAGLALVGLAVVMALLRLDDHAAGILASMGSLTAYFTAALTVFRRG